jgi:glycosyltransferase involved in cell wall biosynthesis
MSRVLLLTDTLGNGGAERQLALLARYLPPGVDARVFALDGGVHLESLHALGIPIFCAPRRFRFDVSPALTLWRTMLSWRPHIVHSWGLQTSLAAIPVCRLTATPLVVSIRSGMVVSQGRLRGTLARACADVVTANSCAGLSAHEVPKEKAAVVYNGFDPERRALARSLPRPAELRPFRIVMVARASPDKDFPAYIAAARVLSRAEPGQWHFEAVCSGPSRDALETASEDLVSLGSFYWPPATAEALPNIAASHAAVLMSSATVGEGCSNALLEYMACGLPIVCTDVGGNAEVVLDDQTGYLIPPGDVEALVSSLRRLRNSPALCSLLGEAGRRRVEQAFTVERMVYETTRAYDMAVCRSRSTQQPTFSRQLQ